MYKLVLGIFIVGVLQLSFVIYSRLQESVDLALAPVQTERARPLPELVLSETPAEPADAPLDEPAPAAERTSLRRSHSTGSAASHRRSVKRRSVHPTPDEWDRPALPVEFKNVVISYGVPSERPAARLRCEPIEPERPKQRTAFAQAERPVVRPWQVITTFDQKLY